MQAMIHVLGLNYGFNYAINDSTKRRNHVLNLRQYKKRAKRARDILIAEFGCKLSDFWYPSVRGEYEIYTPESVEGKDRFGCIPHQLGVPVYLPEIVDYWGEANEPRCCIDLERELRWWDVCGDAFIRKDLAGQAA